jgi:hypothetical protein
MAIYQFKMMLIPEVSLRAQFGAIPMFIEEDMAENFPWWNGVSSPLNLKEKVGCILPRIASWSEAMEIWGNEHSNAILIGYDDANKIEFISTRIDARCISFPFLTDICKLGAELKCVFMTMEFKLIESDEIAVIAAINNSAAVKFVKDPLSTLRNLKND